MILKDFSPDATLRDIVQCYRIVDLDFTGLSKIPVKTWPPKLENCLHFCLEGELRITSNGAKYQVFREPVLVGQHTHTFDRSTPLRLLNFQIVFRSSALYQLFGVPGYHLSELHLEATALFGPEVNSVKQQLQDARSHNQMISIANAFVHRLVKKRKRTASHLDKMLLDQTHWRSATMDTLADDLCLGPKQFKRNFLNATGVNPKTYQRISRFNTVYNFKNRFPEIDWLSVAVRFGYYDYTHLVKDYKDFTGMSPAQYHNHEKISPEVVLGLAGDLYKSRYTGNA